MTTGRINQVTRQIHRGGGSAARAQPNTGTKSGEKTQVSIVGTGPDRQPTNSARPSTKNSHSQERHSLGKRRSQRHNTQSAGSIKAQKTPIGARLTPTLEKLTNTLKAAAKKSKKRHSQSNFRSPFPSLPQHSLLYNSHEM